MGLAQGLREWLGRLRPGSRRARAGSREFLLDLLPKASVGAEIGVHLGDFSAELLRAVHPRELHLIDPWKHESSDTYKDAWYGGKAGGGQAEMDRRHDATRARFGREIAAGTVKVHRGFSGEVLGRFPDGYFDWVYIDGNHLYEFVKADLELSFAKTKPGGYVTGDDYQEGGWWRGGVKRAVDEFVRQKGIAGLIARNQQFAFRKAAAS